ETGRRDETSHGEKSMKPRERNLAMAVAVLVGGLVLWYGYGSIQAGVAKRQTELENLERQVAAKNKIISDGQRAAKKLASYDQRALPSNAERAQSLYQTWLFEQVQKHGLRDSSVTAVGRTNGRGVYTQISFAVKGQANLVQVVKLLYDFYAVDHLHRIRRLRLKPVEGTTTLDVDLLVEVLSLPNAQERNNLTGQPSNRLAHGTMDDYVAMIASRNFFAPPHKSPSLVTTARSSYPIGDAVSFSVRGEDPEKTAVTYAIEQAELEGARIDPKSGDFRWTPSEKGTYEVTLRVTDSGMPAKSATKVVKFSVVDPPPKVVSIPTPPAPKPPAFDTAKFTYLTGIIGTADSTDGTENESEAWLQIRTTGQMLKLHVGDKFDVGTLQGTIREIGAQEIQVETADGKRLLISIGENLREGLPLPEGDI
ncbi:MAG TPA: cadherin repeat domain-containing protein, partial [Pirellulaceae bacterium]|nr:cadherin repeat domain-containing protein [Pirellulaceae bacterium]